MAAAVGTFLFLIFLLFIFVRADFGLRLREAFSPTGAPAWLDSTQKKVARLLFYFAPRLTGMRVEWESYNGGNLPDVFLIVSNHQSLADIPALLCAFPRHSLRFVTKRELSQGIPMISVFLRKGGHALISRSGDYREGRRELVRLANLTGRGISPVVFPEGSRTRTGALRKFQAGAFRTILEHARLPVLSVALDGGYSISRLGTVLSRIGSTIYRVKPLHLYPSPKGKQEILGLLARIEEDIASQILEWRRQESAGN